MSCKRRYIYPLSLWLVLCLFVTIASMTQSAPSFNIRSFNANAINNNLVELNWVVSCNQQDSFQLIVERSTDGVSFQPLYTTLVITDSACRYTDKLPLSDSGFYRVVCKSVSAQPVYSSVQKIKMASRPKIEINIMPNPVFNNASIIINHEETGDITCLLYDLNGKLMRTYQFKKTGQYAQHILDMYSVPRGDYILSIRGTTINESKRILKQ